LRCRDSSPRALAQHAIIPLVLAAFTLSVSGQARAEAASSTAASATEPAKAVPEPATSSAPPIEPPHGQPLAPPAGRRLDAPVGWRSEALERARREARPAHQIADLDLIVAEHVCARPLLHRFVLGMLAPGAQLLVRLELDDGRALPVLGPRISSTSATSDGSPTLSASARLSGNRLRC
jgi:hypothetical protein